MSTKYGVFPGVIETRIEEILNFLIHVLPILSFFHCCACAGNTELIKEKKE
jgi:hypothetical protein